MSPLLSHTAPCYENNYSNCFSYSNNNASNWASNNNNYDSNAALWKNIITLIIINIIDGDMYEYYLIIIHLPWWESDDVVIFFRSHWTLVDPRTYNTEILYTVFGLREDIFVSTKTEHVSDISWFPPGVTLIRRFFILDVFSTVHL